MDQIEAKIVADKIMGPLLDEQKHRAVQPPYKLRKAVQVLSWTSILIAPFFGSVIFVDLTGSHAVFGALVVAATLAALLVYSKNMPAV